MSEREILTIYVDLDESYQVKGSVKRAKMILFHGKAKGTFFTGEILPGGVDTQIGDPEGAMIISARYMLKGVDDQNRECYLFIENNGLPKKEGECTRTLPTIVTDSESLKWMETADLEGTVKPREGGVLIQIYCKDTEKTGKSM